MILEHCVFHYIARQALIFQNVSFATELAESLIFEKGNKRMKLEKNMKNLYQKRSL